MKLQQLRYLLEIERQHFNISKAAEVLCTSQSGISKQIQLLEQELNLDIFIRKGKHILRFSDPGRQIANLAAEIISKSEDIRLLAADSNQRNPSLSIAATHTQARYILPDVVERFVRMTPSVNLHIHQGTPTQIADMLEHGDVDIAIATEALAGRESLLALPCYQWGRSIITRPDNPLVEKLSPTLSQVSEYPIITYVQGLTGRNKVDEAFAKQNLNPDIVLTAVDADVIKTYVRLGLGIGIIADMAFNPKLDKDLCTIEAHHLFGISTSLVAIKKEKYIKNHTLQFIETFAPHLTPAITQHLLQASDNARRREIMHSFSVPFYKAVQKKQL